VSVSVEQNLVRRSPGRRIVALDALRGIAALVVVLHHCRYAFYMDAPRWFLRPLFAGGPAVALFFVLSGYVLSIPYWRGSQPAYSKYLVRRICRIYLPYACATFLALGVGSDLLFAQLPLTSWFYSTWHTPFTLHLIARQLFTMATTPEINTAFWSLRYEMEMSLIFPAICFVLLWLGGPASFVAAVVILKGGYIIWGHSHSPLTFEIGSTLVYGSQFILGAVLSLEHDRIAKVYESSSRWMKLVTLIAIMCGFYTVTRPIFIPFAACGVLILAQHSRVRHLLESAIPEYLGRISYSLYLVHGTVLFVTLILLFGKIPLYFLFPIYFVSALLCGHIFCALVEEPTMKLGKWLTSNRQA
jgi:peptidoglycan/LPS O-acetylase OafA/YrhL